MRLYRRQRHGRRAVAAMAAAAVFTAGIAFAGVPMGRLVVGAWEGIVHLIDGGDSSEDATADGDGQSPPAGDVSVQEREEMDVAPPKSASGRDSNGTEEETVGDPMVSSNQAPTAEDEEVTTDEDTPILIDVLANDMNPNGDALTVVAAQPIDGSVEVKTDGTVTYTPPLDFFGIDSFTYIVADGSAMSGEATVTVNVKPVNDPPVPKDDEATTDEDTPVEIPILANDVDVDDDELTVVAEQPGSGSVAVNADGTVVYTPDMNFAGTDAFTYTVSDRTADPVEATVTVTVNPVNDVPVAQDDHVMTYEDSPVTIPVLANDVDPDGDVLTVVEMAQPDNGRVVLNSDGTVMYMPDPGFVGADAFTYSAFDGTVSAQATVTVLVLPSGDPNSPKLSTGSREQLP